MKRTSSGNTIRIPTGFATLVTLEDLQDWPAWQDAFHDECKDHRFYELTGTTLTEKFDHFFIVLEDEAHRVRAIQPLFFVRQNLTEGLTGPSESVQSTPL